VRYSIEIRTSETIAEVLEKISANTEREIVPFVSAARQTGALGVKPFVSHTSGDRFRVWKVPFASRRRNRCYRYLRGQVKDLNGERHIVGSFALHPFHVVFALIPFVMAATIWAWGDASAWVIALLCAFGLAKFGSATRPSPKEETEILAFVRRLFPGANFDVHVIGDSEPTRR